MDDKFKFLLKDSYLKFIKNSVGTKNFRNLFFEIKGRKKDILKSGELSCAYFVSSVLLIFSLIKGIHPTVLGTVKALKKFGWFEIKKPRKGAILIWEKKKIGGSENFHIGFYIGNRKAISNNYKKRSPAFHHYTYNNKRKIISIFWHKKLDF